MTAPTFTMRQLLEAGVHFGHKTRRWNPKMAPYLFGVRNNVHIIDLQQTVPLLHQAMEAVRAVAASGGRVLFVGTKRQASAHVSEAAKRCGQYFVDHRWLGGMLTNWKTISNSIRRLKDLESQLGEGSEEEQAGLTKKELLRLTREREKLDRALGGIKDMGAPPDIIVVIDTNKEAIAVQEANKLKIPVVAVLDSNSDPVGINHPVPGNDDSLRAIELYCELISAAVLDGLQEEARSTGVDIGESEEAPAEDLGLEAAVAAEEAAAPAEAGPAEAAAQAEAPSEAKADAPTPPAVPPAEAAPAAEADKA
ncbi:MAG: 30S ribosomal protein S2 [Alphaproteobacteria bacterium]|nr:30S ribosomal protein S2 [Alphaproteobacteria bacterium]